MADHQCELGFDAADSDGADVWAERLHTDRERRRVAFERVYGIPLGERVRLRLRHLPDEIEGRLNLADPQASLLPEDWSAAKPPLLAVGTHTFPRHTIIEVTVLE